MALLKMALDIGDRSSNRYRDESALDGLGGRPDFRILLLDLAFPSDPFARGR
jgi:hypothetical protein